VTFGSRTAGRSSTSGRTTSATCHRSEAVREVPERAIGLPRARTALKRRSAATSTAASPDPRVRTSPTCVSPMSRAHVSSSPSAPSGPAEGTSSLLRERGSRIVSAWTTKRDEGPRVLFPWGRGRRLRRALWRGGCARRDWPPLGAGGGSCPASFRDYERAVILSSLSGTVVARDEFLAVWADVEAAMELDLLGVAVRAASKERSSTSKRFQPCESRVGATARPAG
jgi:hypothetical protein